MNTATVKVTVLDANVIERDGKFEDAGGKEVKYSTRKQKAKLDAGGFSYPYDVRLEDGQKPYPVGDYEFDVGAMLQVNKGVASLSKFTVLRPIGKA